MGCFLVFYSSSLHLVLLMISLLLKSWSIKDYQNGPTKKKVSERVFIVFFLKKKKVHTGFGLFELLTRAIFIDKVRM